jgi:hypothetical protein
MSFLTSICKLFKGKAEFKSGYTSELDKFYHAYNEQRKDWLANPLRVKELDKHRAIFNKRDHAVEKNSENLWKDF